MSEPAERYLSADRMGLQPARAVRGRYEIRSPLEPVRSGWTFEYRPARPDEPKRGEWVLWDETGRESYRQSGSSVDADGAGRDHLAEVGLLESLVVPWRLGMTFDLRDALWRRIDERHGLILTSEGAPLLSVTLDEVERARQVQAATPEGELLVAWEPVA